MNIISENCKSQILFSLTGELTYYKTSLLESKFTKIDILENYQLIINLQGVPSISCTALLLFKNLADEYRTKGKTLKMKGVSHFIRESFELAGIEELFVWLEGA